MKAHPLPALELLPIGTENAVIDAGAYTVGGIYRGGDTDLFPVADAAEMVKRCETWPALVAALADCMDRLTSHDGQSAPEVSNAQAALEGLPESQWPFVTPGMELRRAALNSAKP